MGLGTDEIQITGADADELAALRARGVDHGGSAIAPFVDREGGWPLRCCLTDSLPGDVVAIVAWCPFPWRGPYAEVGPVAIHADDCLGVVTDGVPHQFLPRRQLLRPYGHDRRIAYEDISIVEGDGSLPRVLADVVTRARIDFVLAQCPCRLLQLHRQGTAQPQPDSRTRGRTSRKSTLGDACGGRPVTVFGAVHRRSSRHLAGRCLSRNQTPGYQVDGLALDGHRRGLQRRSQHWTHLTGRPGSVS